MQAYISIFASGRVALASWIDRYIIQRPKVTPYSSDLIFKNFVIETSFEFTLSGTRGRDIHRSLPTSENDIVFDWSNCRAVQWGVGCVCLKNIEVIGGDELELVSLNPTVP